MNENQKALGYKDDFLVSFVKFSSEDLKSSFFRGVKIRHGMVKVLMFPILLT